MGLDEYLRMERGRDLRDQVVRELTITLVELEQFKRERRDHQAVVHEADRVQRSLQWALLELGHPVSLNRCAARPSSC